MTEEWLNRAEWKENVILVDESLRLTWQNG